MLQSDTSQTEGGTVRRTIYRTNFKYPLILVNEYSEKDAGGEAKRRVEAMVADHVMVHVPSERRDLFLRQIDKVPEIIVRKALDTGEHFLVTSRSPADLSTIEQITRELGQIGIADSMPDYIAHAHKVPDDPSFSLKWGLHNTGQSSGTADADIDAPEAWEHGVGDRTVTVAVIDTGIDYDHPDLKDNMWKDANGKHGYDYVEDDTDPDDKTGPGNKGHGTHVAGIVGAVGDNATGVVGVCWKVKLMAVRVISENDTATISDIISGIRYATDNGAGILNMSLGFSSSGARDGDLVYKELDRAKEKGVLACIAAGNGGFDQIGDNNDRLPQYPASYSLDNIISVAATDRKDALTIFSNFGVASVDLAAPGQDIYSTRPVVDENSTGYGPSSGTSMASPFVAGAVALALSLNSELTYSDLRRLLFLSVDPIETLKGKIATGGRLNLERLVEMATSPNIETSVEGLVFLDGNGDDYANPDDQLALRFKVLNAGGEAFEGLSAKLVAVSGGDLVEITQSTEVIGDLGIGESTDVASGFRLKLKPTTDLPATIKLRIDVSAAAKPEDVWSANYEFTVHAPARIAGKVVRNGTGLGISGATVHYDGPVEGTATTASDGSFDIAAVAGTFRIHASAPDLLDSAPANVEASITDLSIGLGKFVIGFDPGTLSLRSKPDKQTVEEVALEDTGDAEIDLEYTLKLRSLEGKGDAYAASTADRRSIAGLDRETGKLDDEALYTLPEGESINKLLVVDGYAWIISRNPVGKYTLFKVDLDAKTLLGSYPLAMNDRPIGLWKDAEGVLVAVSLEGATTREAVRFNPLDGKLANGRRKLPDGAGLIFPAFSRGSILVFTRGEIHELDADSLARKDSHRINGSLIITDAAYLGGDEVMLQVLELVIDEGMFKLRFKLEAYDLSTGNRTRTLMQAPLLRAMAVDGTARPKWIQLRQANGVLPSKDSKEISMDIDTASLPSGTYKTRLVLDSKLLKKTEALHVVLQVTDYVDLLEWLEAHGWTADDLGDDPDDDGYSNLQEYIFKGNPSITDKLEGRPSIRATTSGFDVDLLVRSRLPDDSLAIQHSMDLEQWQASEAGVDYRVLSTTAEDSDYERMRLQWLKNDEDKLFIRAEATIDEDL